MLLLNAGAAIYCANLAAGIELSKAIISSGGAQQKIDDLIQLTQGLSA